MPHFYDKKDLENRLTKSKNTVECRESFDDVNVQGLLDGVFVRINQTSIQLLQAGEVEKALNQYSLNIVNSWEQMLVLCNSKGIDFYCVFSPIFTENSMDISNPLIASNIQKFPQHRIRVRKMLHRKVIDLLQTDRYSSLSKSFLDLSIFLDSKQNVYIDPIGHFSPLGNELIANELINHIYK